MHRTVVTMGVALALSALSVRAAAEPGSVAGKVTAAHDGARLWVVYVEKGPEARPRDGSAHREVAQKDSQFEPGATWVRAGDTVDFVNKDNIYHNVFSPTSGAEFDLGLYRGGLKKSVQMRLPGEVDVYCNIHPTMRAKVLVTGEHAAEVGPDGSYSLGQLPPGSYTIVAWSAAHEPEHRIVEVRPGQTARADFTLKTRGAAGPHLNKNGEQYGRYR